jgi:hypothetical protein
MGSLTLNGITPGQLGDALASAFAQPAGQALPREFLAMLVEIDRSHRDAVPDTEPRKTADLRRS